MPSPNLYTLGVMASATITAITSEATGFPKENLVDKNPDTYWKPTTTANQVIDIDLGSAQTIDQFAIWIKNYDTNYQSGTQGLGFAYDSNDDGNYSAVTGVVSELFNNTVGDPIYFPDAAPGSNTKRYWRFSIANMTTIAEISGIFLLRKRAITVYNELPVEGGLEFFNSVSKATGGRQFVRGLTKAQMNPIIRTYIMADTDWTAFQAAIADSQKNLYPLIFTEGSSNILVRTQAGMIKFNKVQEGIYKVTIAFERIPYISDGESY